MTEKSNRFSAFLTTFVTFLSKLFLGLVNGRHVENLCRVVDEARQAGKFYDMMRKGSMTQRPADHCEEEYTTFISSLITYAIDVVHGHFACTAGLFVV